MSTNEIFKVLDAGYVTLTQHMGDDLTPLEAARMSTGNETGVDKTKDDNLRDRLWRDKHSCYDEQTEVLVEGRGFVRWARVSPDEKLGIWDPETGTLVYEAPEGPLIADSYVGPMYRVGHGGVDLLVTPNHYMYVQLYQHNPSLKRNAWASPVLLRAEELGQRAMVRYCKVAPLMGEYAGEISHAELRLMGFFIGDGSARDSRKKWDGITFHLKKKRKVNFLREICAEEGLQLRLLANDTYVVDRDGIADLYADLFYTSEGKKKIPDFMLKLPKEAAESVLAGLRASDGSEKRGAWQYSTSAREVAERVQLLALHAGEAAHINTTSRELDQYEMWNVMFLSRMTHPVINQGKQQVSWEEYSGTVYCARTRTGILVVRRNGKIVLSGNSPFEMNVACFELQVPLFVLRQIDRHRTVNIDAGEVYENYDEFRKFTSRNEFSGRYAVMPDLYYIPDLERIQPQSKKNKQGSDGEMDEKTRTELRLIIQEATNKGRAGYDFLVKEGLANELARMVLPQNQYTKIRIQASMSNWFKFLAERLPEAAQWETRQYAKVIGRELRRIWPLCWQVFESNTLYARTHTSHERAALILGLEALAAGQAKKYSQRVFMPGQSDEMLGQTDEDKKDTPRDIAMGIIGKLYKQMGFNDAAVERLAQKLWPDPHEVDLLG